MKVGEWECVRVRGRKKCLIKPELMRGEAVECIQECNSKIVCFESELESS